MNNNPIDWEATMTQTLTASKAASRGSERVVAAVSEMVEQQQKNAVEMRKSRETMGQILADLQAVRTGQDRLSIQAKRNTEQLQSHTKKWAVQPSQVIIVLGGLFCAALIVSW